MHINQTLYICNALTCFLVLKLAWFTSDCFLRKEIAKETLKDALEQLFFLSQSGF